MTYYVALPFIRVDGGDLVAGEAQECQTAASPSVEREAFQRRMLVLWLSLAHIIRPQLWRCAIPRRTDGVRIIKRIIKLAFNRLYDAADVIYYER